MLSETDKLIREVIREEDKIDPLTNEAPITEMIIQNLRGKRRWITIFPMFLSLIYTGLAVWSGYEFFQAETTQHQIAWATGCLMFAIAIGLTKIWIWGEWQHNSLAREIKRLELAIADLRNRVDS